MSFVEIKNFKGKLFVPDEPEKARKHPCKDCHSCQFCSDERCSLCLKKGGCKGCRLKETPDEKKI